MESPDGRIIRQNAWVSLQSAFAFWGGILSSIGLYCWSNKTYSNEVDWLIINFRILGNYYCQQNERRNLR